MAYDSQKANGQIAAAVIIQAIVYIVVGLRFMTRRKHADGYHVSDWLILLAAFLSTGLAALQIYGMSFSKVHLAKAAEKLFVRERGWPIRAR